MSTLSIILCLSAVFLALAVMWWLFFNDEEQDRFTMDLRREDNYTQGLTRWFDPNTDKLVAFLEWPSIRKAAKYSGVSDRTLRRWRDDGGCGAFSKNNRVCMDVLAMWAEANGKTLSPPPCSHVAPLPVDMWLEENELACSVMPSSFLVNSDGKVSFIEAERMLGVTERTLRDWRNKGCPGFEAGRVDPNAVERWMIEQRHAA